jgi:hypothetical protein
MPTRSFSTPSTERPGKRSWKPDSAVRSSLGRGLAFSSVQDEIARFAARALDGLRAELRSARKFERQEPWTHSSEDEMGPREQAMLSAAHRGLDHLNYLRKLGAPWLSSQDESVRREVDEAERELEVVKAEAISMATHHLPRHVPPNNAV